MDVRETVENRTIEVRIISTFENCIKLRSKVLDICSKYVRSSLRSKNYLNRKLDKTFSQNYAFESHRKLQLAGLIKIQRGWTKGLSRMAIINAGIPGRVLSLSSGKAVVAPR